jgi:D-glycero-D-manno-heptose 1,7-bisphosphate phosphatase
MTPKRFVLLDRDGTIIRERHYLSDPQHVELLPNAAKGLRLMQEMNLGLVGITNQSAIGRGYFDEVRLEQIHQRMGELLAAEAVFLDGIYYCPHTPADDCQCRKPRVDLVNRAVKALEFSPHESFVIGDKPCDIELGQRVGATTFLVRTGYGAQFTTDGTVNPDYIVDDLWEAALVIQELLAAERRVELYATRG